MDEGIGVALALRTSCSHGRLVMVGKSARMGSRERKKRGWEAILLRLN
jgi:hypothetical protein